MQPYENEEIDFTFMSKIFEKCFEVAEKHWQDFGTMHWQFVLKFEDTIWPKLCQDLGDDPYMYDKDKIARTTNSEI